MSFSRLRSTAVLASALASLALASAACHAQPPESPADAAFGKRVHAYLLAHPEVLQEVFDRLQAKEDAGKAADVRAAIAGRRALLERDPRDPVLGNPRGAVTIVEFFDYRCPFCKAAEPALETLLAQNPDVRLVLKEFPILDLEDHTRISEDATRASLAANAQGKYVVVHRALLADKHLDEAEIATVLKAAGVDAVAAQAAERSTAITTQIVDVHALAQALGIDGTPGFVVGDKIIAGAQMDLLRAAIAQARKAARP